MKLCKEELDKAAKDSRIHKNQVRVRIICHIESLPEEIRDSARWVLNETKDYDKYSLNIALAYGGREEIIRAIRNMVKDIKDDNLKMESQLEKKEEEIIDLKKKIKLLRRDLFKT